MLLTNNLRSITIETNATATTTEPSFSTSFIDTLESHEQNAIDLVGALTGVTAVSVVPAIGAGVKARTVCGIAVTNRDTVSHTVTVKKVSAGTGYQIYKATLGAGESMNYDGSTWSVFAASGEIKQATSNAASTASGASNIATVVAAETGVGVLHQTVLTLTDVAQAVANGTEYQSTKLYTFPEGRIAILGCVSTLAQKTTSAILSTLNGGSTGAVALGSAAASNTTLSSTMADIAPSTAFTSSATINVAGTAVNPVLAAAAQLDGHTTPVAVYLNSAYATTTDVDADATQTWTGTVTLTWVNLGDFT